ncbi:MAG: YggS family pyridoxal phosphate-dependent enzyme [Myxococcales bacterium]|nr:YggS family pyridoxal phosphate-dependent enzyme [Myxococcales bacterium]
MVELILASGSPRRHAFLVGASVPHRVRPTGADETVLPGERPEAYALRLAGEKAELAWKGRSPGDPAWVLTADTVVEADGRVLDKPGSAGEAVETLRALSGRGHRVHTAWALRGEAGLVEHEVCTAEVVFGELSDKAIAGYVATGDPLDKAGAYGIQGPAGRFVERVEGAYSAVVGLPIERVFERLVALGIVSVQSPVEHSVRVVRARIAAAESGNGLAIGAVRLVGVSKRQAASTVEAGVAAGLTDLGENYVQAWQERVARFPASVRWHLIGHLQRNKVRLLDERVALIHGVDGVRTVEALARLGRSQGRLVRYLAQVNVGDEGSKAGLAPEALGEFLAAVDGLEGVRLEGLMAVPPPSVQAGARRWFSLLRRLRDAHRSAEVPLHVLSMGMSGDYEAAIAEGATHVRVGSALFGSRTP